MSKNEPGINQNVDLVVKSKIRQGVAYGLILGTSVLAAFALILWSSKENATVRQVSQVASGSGSGSGSGIPEAGPLCDCSSCSASYGGGYNIGYVGTSYSWKYYHDGEVFSDSYEIYGDWIACIVSSSPHIIDEMCHAFDYDAAYQGRTCQCEVTKRGCVYESWRTCQAGSNSGSCPGSGSGSGAASTIPPETTLQQIDRFE